MKSLYIFHGWCAAVRSCALLMLSIIIISGCSSNVGDTTAGVGTGGTGSLAKLDITDTPATNFTHVYVTVTSVAFHTDASTSFSNYSSSKASGWQVFKLTAPKTIDLVQLANGTMFADVAGSSLFSGMSLPVGSYHQIRIFLASTEYTYVGSLPGLVYNNEIQITGDTTHYPLRIPASEEGIKVVPESPVVMANGSTVNLALDFNVNDDVVEVSPNGSTEFMLKPRLGYFDMERVGSIRGTVAPFSNFSTSNIEIKAEQVKSGTGYRVVRRTTSADKATGTFNLYPLPIFGNASTAVYDILMRGRNIQTTIIKGVKIHRGTTRANGVDLGSVVMQPGTEFTAHLTTAVHPSGSWLNFYQTISGDTASYEVRYRHLDPYTGKFVKPVELSAEPIRVASFIPGSPLVFTSDYTSQGSFSVVANATDLYERGAELSGISDTAGKNKSIPMTADYFPKLNSAASAGRINCVFDMVQLGTGKGPGMGLGNLNIGYPTKGQVFITNGGMIIDSIGTMTDDTTVNTAMHAGGGANNPVMLQNLPSNISGAVYGIYILGWGNGYLAAGHTLDIDLRKEGSATATIKIK